MMGEMGEMGKGKVMPVVAPGPAAATSPGAAAAMAPMHEPRVEDRDYRDGEMGEMGREWACRWWYPVRRRR